MFSKFQCWRCDKVTSEGKKCSVCGMAYYCTDRCRINDEFRHNTSECKDVAVRYVCHGCNKKTKEQMKMCTNCMKVWFCGKECQKQAWKNHKDECKAISRATIELASKQSGIFRLISAEPGMSELYYWGNSPALDLLNLPMNEGLEYSQPLSLLLCGVGDPRNVCLTISKLQDTEHQGKVTFVMNDICACTLARTVLLLYLLCKGGEPKAESVTQIWYSIQLSEENHQFVVDGLRDLVQISNLELVTLGIMNIDADQFNRLKNVWKTWLRLSGEDINLLKRRRRSVKKEEIESSWGIECYFGKMPVKHRSSVKDWYKNGLLLPRHKRKNLTKENFTLTGFPFRLEQDSRAFDYSIHSCSFPYQGWDYKAVSAVYPKVHCVSEMYNDYITDVLRKTAQRLQKDDIQLSFILCHCTDITPYLPEGVAFDRITMSNLCDFIPLPSLLNLVKPLQNSLNKSAVIVTESANWSRLYPDLYESKLSVTDLLPLPFSELRYHVLQDTGGRTNIAESSDPYAFIEYFSFKEEFICYLRASLIVPISPEERARSSLPSINQLAAELGLKPRDFTNCENKVAPFRWLLNCRRITLMRGLERTVEWVLSDQFRGRI